jgi:hypothetical protein
LCFEKVTATTAAAAAAVVLPFSWDRLAASWRLPFLSISRRKAIEKKPKMKKK